MSETYCYPRLNWECPNCGKPDNEIDYVESGGSCEAICEECGATVTVKRPFGRD